MSRDHHGTARERVMERAGEPSAVGVRLGRRGSADHIVPPALGDYAELLEHAPSVLCELSDDGTVLYANEAIGKIAGYAPQALRGRRLWDILCPGELRAQVDDLNRRLAAGDVSDFLIAVKAANGAVKSMAWNFSRFRANGHGHRLVGVGSDISHDRRADDELQRTVGRLQRALEGTIEAIALTAEIRDPYTAGHQRRVALLACGVAGKMELSGEHIKALRLAGTIHDLGKISVPIEILAKRAPLTEKELELLQAHPQVGYAILSMIDLPWPVARIVYQHHERYDGSGYPMGLSGGDILLEARILAVADVVESMAGPRPYRAALGIGEAIQEISSQRGVLFDPNVVDACLAVLKEGQFEWD